MYRHLQIAVLATLLATFSFYLWRISFTYSDWAILALVPLTVIIVTSIWPLTLDPWKARLDIALRNESTWKKWLTGGLRTILLSSVFTLGSVTLLAWQAWIQVSSATFDLTAASSSAMASSGVFHPRVLPPPFDIAARRRAAQRPISKTREAFRC